MKTFSRLLFIALCVMPAAAHAQSVKVHYDRTVDFTRFKTYSWIKGRAASSPEIDKLIVEDVGRSLQAKGLQEASERADLHIAYYASLDDNINVSAVEYAKGVDWKKWGEHEDPYGPKMVAMPIARMILDIIDASSNTLVWRGSARDAFTPNQKRRKNRVNTAVARMLAKYPPPRHK